MGAARWSAFYVASALVALGLVHCNGELDSTSTPPGADAEPPEASIDPPIHDAGAPDRFCCVDGSFDDFIYWSPKVFVIDERPQPNPNDPGFTVPRFVVTNESTNPKRKPDVYVDSKKLGGVGSGCIAYGFTSANPLDPKGPGLTSGDMGSVVIQGYSGGTYLGGPSADAGIPSPTTCTRAEIVPGSGLFAYDCGSYRYPATGFLGKTDQIVAKIAGGADITSWSLKTAVSPYDDLNVDDDLWHVTPDMIDGSKDLTFTFDCGGADCTMSPFIRIVIESSDGRDQDAAPASPFDFPPRAKKEFGLVECIDYLPLYKNTYTIAKSLLAEIPPTWTDLRITVATLNAATGEVDNGQPIFLGAGFARFGITHR